MIKNNIKILLTLVSIILIYSCKAQEIKIIMSNGEKVEVLSIIHNDTIQISGNENNLFKLNSKQRKHLIIKYKEYKFELKPLSDNVKTIIINYEAGADDKCYLVHIVENDTIQTYYSNYIKRYGLNSCKRLIIINIYTSSYNENDAIKRRNIIKKRN